MILNSRCKSFSKTRMFFKPLTNVTIDFLKVVRFRSLALRARSLALCARTIALRAHSRATRSKARLVSKSNVTTKHKAKNRCR